MKITELEKIKLIKDDKTRAHELVKYLFKDKKDKEGKPYIYHLERVSNKLSKENTQIAGLLHDIVEDTEFTFNDLKEYNFNSEIIELVKIVTKNKTENKNYHDRITSIINTNNIEAIKLKYFDILDNSNPERLNKLTESQKKYFIEKYQKELKRLKEILKERGEII